MEYKFKNTYTFEGQEYDFINLDLDGMTGKDMSQAKREWTAQGNFSAVITADMDFAICVAAKASKLPIEFFEQLPAREYAKVAQEVTNFLLV